MKPKTTKLFSLVLSLVLVCTFCVHVSATTGFNKKEKSTINEESAKELLKKYNVEILSKDEVKALNFNETATPKFTPTSLDQLEQYLIEKQNQPDIVIEDEVTVPINVDKTTNLSIDNSNIVTYGYTTFTTIYTTKTFSRTSTPLTDLTVKYSAAGSYQYDYCPLPSGPPIIQNLHFNTCDNGDVTALTGEGYNRLAYVNYSKCIINTSTQLKHTYSYYANMYTCIGVPGTPFSIWVKIGGRTITGTTYYNLSV